MAERLLGDFDMLDEHGKKIEMECTDLSGANLIGQNILSIFNVKLRF